MRALVSSDVINQRIFILRGHKVMFSPHLAELYEVEAKVLIQAVKRNKDRFPADFMFQLNAQEYENLKSQIVTSSWGGARRAVRVNIAIMRAFVRLREALSTHKELAFQFKELERKVGKHDEDIQAIFRAIQRLMTEPEKPKGRFGFYQPGKEK